MSAVSGASVARGFSLAVLLLPASGCHSLDVENINAPDRERVLASSEDVKNLMAGATNNWYLTEVGLPFDLRVSPVTLATMADQMTAPWNNFDIRRMSAEPRESFSNNVTGGNVGFFWDFAFASTVSANLVLLSLEDGLQIGPGGADNVMIETTARFLQGANLSTLALLFDQAYVIDEHSDPAVFPPFAEAATVRDAALERLDQAIALAQAHAFVLPDRFFNHPDWTSQRLAQLANTIAAQTLAYFARTADENRAAPWDRVLRYAREGISKPGAVFDPTVTGDNAFWIDGTKAWADDFDFGGSVRMDQALVCRMDTTQPCDFPDSGLLPPPQSADQRVSGPQPDFVYYPSVPWDVGRGRYRFSQVGQIRYREHAFTFLGDVPFLLAAENDLLIAEALIRSGGSRAEAAGLINRTRVGRGGLEPLTGGEGDQAILDALFYERDVELFASDMNAPYFDARRTDRLQPLTPRQLPVPGDELSLRGEPIYTFGGADNPDQSPAAADGAARWSPSDLPRVPYRGGVLQANPRLFARLRAARPNPIGARHLRE